MSNLETERNKEEWVKSNYKHKGLIRSCQNQDKMRQSKQQKQR